MNPIEEIEAVASPYSALLKWGGIALLAAGIFAGGIVFGRYTAAVTTADAKTETAHCETARATDNGNANAAAAQDLGDGAAKAARADAGTTAADRQTGQHYDQAQEDANHATPSGDTIDAAPLLTLFRGMRDDATASSTDADRGDPSAAAVH